MLCILRKINLTLLLVEYPPNHHNIVIIRFILVNRNVIVTKYCVILSWILLCVSFVALFCMVVRLPFFSRFASFYSFSYWLRAAVGLVPIATCSTPPPPHTSIHRRESRVPRAMDYSKRNCALGLENPLVPRNVWCNKQTIPSSLLQRLPLWRNHSLDALRVTGLSSNYDHWLWQLCPCRM